MIEKFSKGMTTSFDFAVSKEEMAAFSKLSGDRNPLHLDGEFAKSKGYPGPVVYGALLVAKVSRIVGMHYPGSDGVWSSVSMDFRAVLAQDEPACLTAEIQHVSAGTGSIVVAIKITADDGGRVVATGKAMANLHGS